MTGRWDFYIGDVNSYFRNKKGTFWNKPTDKMMPSNKNKKTNEKEIIVMAKFADHMEKIGSGVVEGYKKIENGVVTGYKKIESGAVEGFGKVVDKCVEVLFAKDGESAKDAKARLSGRNRE